jgi:hypothetical protein
MEGKVAIIGLRTAVKKRHLHPISGVGRGGKLGGAKVSE